MTDISFLKRPLLNTVNPLGSISYLGYNNFMVTEVCSNDVGFDDRLRSIC